MHHHRVNHSSINETPDEDVFKYIAGAIVKRNKKMEKFEKISCFFKSSNDGIENGAHWSNRYKVKDFNEDFKVDLLLL